MFTADIMPMLITIAVLIVTVIFFTLGKFRSDLVALCALLSLMLLGVLTPQEALSGFSNSIIITIACVFVIGGAIVRSGLANAIGGKILSLAGDNHNVLFMLVMLITATVGSLVSNTGTVAIMMPIVVSMANSISTSPSRFLMPVAFMSSIGGMITLIGNPGNMVVNDVYVKAGYDSLTLFSFLPVGIVSLVFGMLILAPVTSFFLSKRKVERDDNKSKGVSLKELADKYSLGQNIYKVVVSTGSSMIGQSLIELGLTGKFGVGIQNIHRMKKVASFSGKKNTQIAPTAQTVIELGDILYCMGSLNNVQSLVDTYALKLENKVDPSKDKDAFRFDAIGICELVLMSSSPFVHRTIAESKFRDQFGITVLGIQRGDQYILEGLKDQTIQSGDSLLVQGSWETLSRLAEYSLHWVVVGGQAQNANITQQAKIPLVATVLFLMITSMATGLLPTVVAVMLAAVVLVFSKCFNNLEEAYSFINWETIVMIACMLPMAIAMEKTGIVKIVSEYMTKVGAEHGPFMALAVVYGVTSFMNIIISATPVALLVAPVSIQIALDLGYSPLPFVYAVAVSSCMCFASPFSTPSNALVMSAGRYTFFDYLKIGLPLQALMGVYMVFILPLLFPFTP